MRIASSSCLTLLVVTLSACGSTPSPAPVDASPPDIAPADASRADATDAASGLIDDRFTPRQWEILSHMSPVPRAPANSSNRYADDARAAALGRAIFDDRGFSRGGQVACSTCHQRERLFTDGRAVAVAQDPPQRGRRNTPTILYADWGRWKLWDGGADTLWAQPILAMENPREHDSSRLEIAHRVATAYRAQYEDVFGALPPLDDAARFPAAGRAGDVAWEGMRPDDQRAVLRVVANVGKALEAYERTLTVGPSAFDRYMAGDLEAMTPQQRDGLKLFITLSCINCHEGPLFSDDLFHSLRVPDDATAGPDRGRAEGLETAARNPLGAHTDYSDDPAAFPAPDSPSAANVGQFRTPTLRGVALTAPYGHAGTLATLEEVIAHDAAGGLAPNDPRAQGVSDRDLIPFQPRPGEVAALVAFLHALTPDEYARP